MTMIDVGAVVVVDDDDDDDADDYDDDDDECAIGCSSSQRRRASQEDRSVSPGSAPQGTQAYRQAANGGRLRPVHKH